MEMADLSRRPLEELLEEYRLQFEGFFLPAVSSILHRESVPQVYEPVLYSLEAGGKRIRPMLVLACAGIAPGNLTGNPVDSFPPSGANTVQREALFTGAAVECIHTYSLIHDDLPAMDDDDVRRGRPSCHKKFPEWAALLAGDTLNTFAFRLLAEAGGQVARKVRLLSDSAGHAGMTLGQALDLAQEKKDFRIDGPGDDFEFRFRDPDVASLLTGVLSSAPPGRMRKLLAIHLHKTGALIRAACELGAVCAGISDETYLHLYSYYGEGLGLLFQIVDDILDVVGDPALLGKAARKDGLLGKLTFPGLIGLDESRALAGDLCSMVRRRASEISTLEGDGPARQSFSPSRLLDDLAFYVLKRDR